MGLFPVRARRSEIGRASQTPQGSIKRISSERAADTSSGGKAASVMSSRNCHGLLSALRPSDHSDHAEPPDPSSASVW
eukprot:15249879-Alexandrium_andersonii.AAC.2